MPGGDRRQYLLPFVTNRYQKVKGEYVVQNERFLIHFEAAVHKCFMVFLILQLI